MERKKQNRYRQMVFCYTLTNNGWSPKKYQTYHETTVFHVFQDEKNNVYEPRILLVPVIFENCFQIILLLINLVLDQNLTYRYYAIKS